MLAAVDPFLLPTSLANNQLYEVVSREGPVEGGDNWKTVPPRPYFDVICHFLWSLSLALFGGFLARYFYSVQEPAASSRNLARAQPGSEAHSER